MEQSESQPNKIKQSKPRPKKKGKKNETKQKKQKVATISVRFFFQRQVFFFSVNEKRGKKKIPSFASRKETQNSQMFVSCVGIAYVKKKRAVSTNNATGSVRFLAGVVWRRRCLLVLGGTAAMLFNTCVTVK